MNSTNVESESYSDYFNPMPDISDDTLPKKLKPDNMVGSLSSGTAELNLRWGG